MRVVHLCTIETGAATRLHQGLRKLGFDSTMFVAERRTADPSVKVFVPGTDVAARVQRRWARMRIARDMTRYRRSRPAPPPPFFDDRSPYGAECLAQLPPFDILHVHTMLHLVDFRALFAAVPQQRPVIRTLHDMTFFTGGCHYAWGCDKYVHRCGECPQLGSKSDRDLSRRIWERKREALRRVPDGRFHVVSSSEWLAGVARRSSLLEGVPISIIPYALDTDVFRPRDRAFARDLLGVPAESTVVLFVAEPITRPEKGFALCVEALQGLDEPGMFFLSVGSGRPPVDVRIPHLHAGHVSDARMLSLYYNAADVFVMPSLQEAFGQTALEATACGTPVVAFATGGIPDIVRRDVTGSLVPVNDVAGMRLAIQSLLKDRSLRGTMAANCRRIAVEEFALDVQARRYIELYERILHTSFSGRR